MNASAVKPALSTGGVQAPKVLGAPQSAPNPPTTATVSPPKPQSSNTSGSPVKPTTPVNANHAPSAAMPLPLSLVQEKSPASNTNQQQPPLGLLRPEKKEYPFSPAPIVKPTSNGVEGSPNKTSPAIPPASQPVEIKKPDEESAALPVLNHSVEPVKLPAVVPPPLPVVTPPTPILPVPTPPTESIPTSPTKQEPVLTTTTNHTNNTVDVTVAETKPVLVTPTAPLESTPVIPSPTITSTTTPITVTPPAVPDSPPKPAAADIPKIRLEAAKSEFKVATPPRNSKRKKEVKVEEGKSSTSDDDDRKSKRVRTRTQPYQSPIPELTYIAKSIKTLSKSPDDKLIVFYKNEFLAVRNSEGSFYVCQAMQNIFKGSARIRIRWLSQDKKDNKTSDVYIPDFYDHTDFDCILTNLELKKMDKTRFQLPAVERERTQNILKRSLDVDKGVGMDSSFTEEHPDGLDLSLYRDESQLKKRKKGSKRGAKGEEGDSESDSDEDDDSDDESESGEEEDAKKVLAKPSASSKKIEKPRAPVKEKAKIKDVDRRAERVSEREKRVVVSKRKSEPIPPAAATTTGKPTRPPPEKKARVPVKPAKKIETTPESAVPTRSAKTRNVKAVLAPKSLPVPRTKEREPRKVAVPTITAKGRKKPGKKA